MTLSSLCFVTIIIRAKKEEPNSSLPGLDLSYELTRFIFFTKDN